MASVWDDEAKTEQLKKLYAEGLSSSQIAAEMHCGLSRNAVIGRIHRLGLERRGKTAGMRKSTKVKSPRIRSNPLVDRWGPKRAPLPYVCMPAAEIAPLYLTIMDLTPTSCRYPYTKDERHTFCGHTRIPGSSYCAPHFKIVRKEDQRRSVNVRAVPA